MGDEKISSSDDNKVTYNNVNQDTHEWRENQESESGESGEGNAASRAAMTKYNQELR